MTPEEARRQAVLRLGGVEQTKLYRDRRLPARRATRLEPVVALREE